MEHLLYTKIDDSNHHSVEAEDEERADGDEGDDSAFDIVE
jgi:hypothetical protein